MKFHLLSIIVFFGFSFTVSAEEIRIGAGAAPMENIFKRVEAPFKAATGIQLNLTKVNPKTAIEGLDNNQFETVTVAFDFNEWMEMVKKDGYTPKDQANYKYRVVGKDNLVFLVHKTNSIQKLSQDQLRDLFTGKITNWKNLGGPDLPVSIVIGSDLPGMNNMAKKKILGGADFATANQITVTSAVDIQKKVGSTPGAVAFGPLGLDDASVKRVSSPEIGRPVTIITKGTPSKNMLKLFNFLTNEGSKHVAK